MASVEPGASVATRHSVATIASLVMYMLAPVDATTAARSHTCILHDIELERLHVQPFGAQRLRCHHAASGISGAESHVEPGRRQPPRRFAADPLVGAGHQRAFRCCHIEVSVCGRPMNGEAWRTSRVGNSLDLV